MDKKIKFSILMVAVLVSLFLVSWTIEKLILIKSEIKKVEYSINVQGEGKITAIPNVAEINISVISEAKTNKITEFLKSNSIEEKDIKTINYDLSPKYQYEKGKTEVIGYVQSQTLLVKVRKFEKVGDVIKGAIEIGANQVGDLRFTIDDPVIYRAQAREKAILNAKEKAIQIAKSSGIKLGRVINVVEGYVSVPEPQRYYMEKAYGVGGGDLLPPSIEKGSQEIVVSVTVTFAVK